jgi:hypothetical protein
MAFRRRATDSRPIRNGLDDEKETTMKIVTSLSFQGQCREAFEYYAKVLGGRITAAISYGDAPPGMPISDPKYKDWLMHCWLEVGDQALMGADMDEAWAPNIDKPGGRACRHALLRDLLVAGLWLARGQVRRAVDGQHHPAGRLELAGLIMRVKFGDAVPGSKSV